MVKKDLFETKKKKKKIQPGNILEESFLGRVEQLSAKVIRW